MGKVIKSKTVKQKRYEIVRYLFNKQFVFKIRILDLLTTHELELEYDYEAINNAFFEMTTFTYTEEF